MLNCDKTYFLQFLTKTNNELNMQVSCGDRTIATALCLKFLGLTINTTVNWNLHIGELTPRLNKACYAITSIKLFMYLDVLRSTYFHMRTQLYLMELYFEGIHLIVKTYLKFGKE
jgi:hypothetical protein